MENLILKEYSDRCYITYILCDLSYNFYSNIYNVCMLPTILGSSVLTILNSSEIDNEILKKINISVNGLNAIVLALVNSYRLNDRMNTFNNSKIKFNKLNHLIESILTKNSNNEIGKDIIENIITDYDKLYEDLTYQFPNSIRKKVIKKWGGIKKLPNSLEIDYNSNVKMNYMNGLQTDVIINNV